jgi:hypothetical protein
MSEDQQLRSLIAREFELGIQDVDLEQIKERLAAKINELVNSDFQKLVNILYRIDVNESKLKQMLSWYKDEDAGRVIAELIIERQIQKIRSRESFKNSDDQISDEEKW